VRQLALGVHHAHEHGIYHGDVKPGNVLMQCSPVSPKPDSGERGELVPVLTGFDTATVRFLPPTLLGATPNHWMAISGTPVYMAPERLTGSPPEVGATDDVWALGVVLYELVSGRLPFLGDTAIGTLQAVLEQEPPLLREVAAGTDDDLERICMKCLRKKPQDRYASAAELAEDLARHARGERRPPPERPTFTRRLGGWVRGLWGPREASPGQSS
jgi:serine/threonine protein kinase